MIAYTNLTDRGEEDLIDLVDELFTDYQSEQTTAPQGFVIWAWDMLGETRQQLMSGELFSMASELLYLAENLNRDTEITFEVCRAWLEVNAERLVKEIEEHVEAEDITPAA